MFDRVLRRISRVPSMRRALLRVAERLAPYYRALRAETAQAPIDDGSETAPPSLAESIDIPEIAPLVARPSTAGEGAPRLNLLVPGLSERHVFGGIATALQFFDRLRGSSEVRILVLDELAIAPRKDAYYSSWPVYTLADIAQADPSGPHVVVCGDRYGRSLPVRRGDRFVATIWWSAHLALRMLDWQHEHFPDTAARFVYLIQDYEPGFYPWSSRFALAEATYRQGDRTLAVVNTPLLADYLSAQGVAFRECWVFSPRLNPRLAQLRTAGTAHRKERLLIAYGRPGTERNAFALLISALRYWVAREPDAAAWQVVSAGEDHPPIALGRDMTLHALGKLDILEYGALLSRAAVGVSLMISPHPSYPPLEMAAFGCRVVTNGFANKDLGAVCPSITSALRTDAASLAEAISDACRRAAAAGFAPAQQTGLDTFLDGGEPFAFVEELKRHWLQA